MTVDGERGSRKIRENSPAKKKQLEGHKPTMSVAKVAPSTFAAHFDKTDSAGKNYWLFLRESRNQLEKIF